MYLKFSIEKISSMIIYYKEFGIKEKCLKIERNIFFAYLNIQDDKNYYIIINNVLFCIYFFKQIILNQ